MGSGNGNGNGKGVAGKTAIQAGNMFIAETIGAGIEVGVLTGLDKFDETNPDIASGIKSFLKLPVRIFQPAIEWCLKHTKSIEGKDDFERRIHETPEQRQDSLARAVYHYTTAIGVGYGSMYLGQKALNNLLKTPIQEKENLKIWGIDAAVHVGSVVALGSPYMEGVTERIKNATSCVLKQLGYDDKKSDEYSKYLVVVQLPNFISYLNNIRMLRNLNNKEALEALSHVHV